MRVSLISLAIFCIATTSTSINAATSKINLLQQQINNSPIITDTTIPRIIITDFIASSSSSHPSLPPLLPLPLPALLDDADHYLPDPTLTPGAIFDVDTDTVCVPGYSRTVRSVSEAEREAVYASYSVAPYEGYCDCPQGCEVDHLISLEIGGSNDQTNLWPQPYCGDENAHVKDTLENKLHKLMCDGTIDMKTAQNAISTNWIQAYNTYVASGQY